MAGPDVPTWHGLAHRVGVPTAPHARARAPITRKPLRANIAEDLRSPGVERYRWHHRFTHRVIYFQVLLRRAEYWDSSTLPFSTLMTALTRLRGVRLGETLGFTVPMHVTAPRFSIAHPGTVVISHRASVGRNCRVHTDICIGELAGKAPVIGDDVWIGPGAKIFGGITVGDRALIGANAVVRADVPRGVTVAGIPARIISHDDSSGLQHHLVTSEDVGDDQVGNPSA